MYTNDALAVELANEAVLDRDATWNTEVEIEEGSTSTLFCLVLMAIVATNCLSRDPICFKRIFNDASEVLSIDDFLFAFDDHLSTIQWTIYRGGSSRPGTN